MTSLYCKILIELSHWVFNLDPSLEVWRTNSSQKNVKSLMRVRPTLQPGHGTARIRPEIGTVINAMFSTTTTKKVCSCAGRDFGLTRPRF